MSGKVQSRPGTLRAVDYGLEGRCVVVTGGGSVPGRGMGREICLGFAAAGARVVVVDIDPVTAKDTADAICASGGTAIAVQADVSSSADVARIAQIANDRFGTVDVLVNHVGIGNHTSLLDTTEEWWDRCHSVNLKAPFLTARQFLPAMLAQGRGVILNTISICGLTGGRSGPAYTASKHGLVGLTRNIASAYGDQGIRCVGIAPGSVRSDDTHWDSAAGSVVEEVDRSGFWPSLTKALDLGHRRGKPGEVAAVAVFLASDLASFINGAVLPVDGGWTAI